MQTPPAAPAAVTTDNPKIADVIEATGEVFELVKPAAETPKPEAPAEGDAS